MTGPYPCVWGGCNGCGWNRCGRCGSRVAKPAHRRDSCEHGVPTGDTCLTCGLYPSRKT